MQPVNIEDKSHSERNKDWVVTVNIPEEGATVISFPSTDITRRCIYTEDGRILANQIAITVADPDGVGDHRIQKWLR